MRRTRSSRSSAWRRSSRWPTDPTTPPPPPPPGPSTPPWSVTSLSSGRSSNTHLIFCAGLQTSCRQSRLVQKQKTASWVPQRQQSCVSRIFSSPHSDGKHSTGTFKQLVKGSVNNIYLSPARCLYCTAQHTLHSLSALLNNLNWFSVFVLSAPNHSGPMDAIKGGLHFPATLLAGPTL